MLISIICGFVTGRTKELADSIFSGAQESVELIISLFGMMCFWTGFMKIAELGGVTSALSKIFSPVLKKLFPEYKSDSKVISAICMNITANLLGLGNAATPMGIMAMKEMQKKNLKKETANNSMAMFVVINTASIQLIPTFMAILRQKHGASEPFDVLPAIWIVSIISLIIGITAAKVLEKWGKKIE